VCLEFEGRTVTVPIQAWGYKTLSYKELLELNEVVAGTAGEQLLYGVKAVLGE
jgi:hypothetical protein